MNRFALPPDIERLISLQERFEDLRAAATLRAGARLADLAYANPYDGAPPPVIDAIRRALEQERTLDLQYTPYGGSTVTRRLIAHKLSRIYGQQFHWRDIILTPGAMAGLNVLFQALRSESEPAEVIVITPCWLDYPLYLCNLGLRPVFVEVDTRTLRLDIERIRAALTPATRALILSQPANPTGVVYSRAEVEALADVLRAAPSEVVLISDECHRDVLFDVTECPSALECYDATCVVYSFGKSLFIQGQRIGYVAVSPRMPNGKALAKTLERLCRVMGFCTPTALMQIAVRELLNFKPDLGAMATRRGRMLTALAESGFDFTPPEGTFFVYPRSPMPDDFAFATRLADEGVLVLPSAVFHHAGHFRVSLTATDAQLAAALPALKRVAAQRTD